MPKKRTGPPHPLEVIRKGIGISQADFARKIGLSASMIKKIEGGIRDLPQDVMCRIFFETGLWIVPGVAKEPFIYTREDYDAWKNTLPYNELIARQLAHQLSKWVEMMMLAAARPGIDKGFQLYHVLLQEIQKISREFQMERHIEAWLRDRNSTETKAYTVRELRANDLLARMVEFKDDPKYKDDDVLPLTKSVGWMPTKEIFNIAWNHRTAVQEILRDPNASLTPEQEVVLEEMEKQFDAEIKRTVGD
jgi:transcriptional regulator with XRE-family HTH domain